jgi:hypothetical protein
LCKLQSDDFPNAPTNLTRYIQFHPLAYLVKLNIEMTMANLIKRIAISASKRNGQHSIAEEFKSSSNLSTTGKKSGGGTTKRQSQHELASIVSYHAEGKADTERVHSFAPTGNQIKTTQSVTVTSEPATWGRRGSEAEVIGGYMDNKMNMPSMIVEETGTPRTKSIDSSVKSADVAKRGPEDSDDEAALVGRNRGWGRASPR